MPIFIKENTIVNNELTCKHKFIAVVSASIDISVQYDFIF